MVFRCPRGTKKQYRVKTTKAGKVRLGGCARKGRFVKVKETKKLNKVVVRGKKNGKPFKKVITTTLGVVALGQALRVQKAFGDAVITQIKKVN